MKKHSYRIICLCLCLCTTCLIHAGGFQIYSESATDLFSLGGAGVAREGHASSAWYNPAAAVTIDRPSAYFGGSALKLSLDYKGERGTDHLNNQPRYMGFFYGVLPIDDTFSLTLSVNAPYGMITQWDSGSELSHIATFTSIRCCYITPGLVWKINDHWSIAGGPNAVIGVARLASYPLQNQSSYAMLPSNLRGNKLYMRADGEGIGGWLAMHYRLNDSWSFGLRYQSEVRLRLAGDASYRTPGTFPLGGDTTLKFLEENVHTHIILPATLALGIQNSSFDNWRFFADAVWTEWSTYHSLDINFDSLPAQGTRGKARNRRNWNDVWSYHIGAEYLLSEAWTIRAGYAYDLSPNNDRHNSPEMPDSNKHIFACGIGYRHNNWGVDLAYGYVHFESSKLGSQTAKEKGVSYQGTFRGDCHIFSLAFKIEL